jgi:hypothetical protein
MFVFITNRFLLSQRKFKDRIVEEERVEQRRAYDFNDRRRRGE